MFTGLNGLNDAEMITHARMQDVRDHLQAIRDAQAAGQQSNLIKDIVQWVVALSKRLRLQSAEATQTRDIPAVKLNNERV